MTVKLESDMYVGPANIFFLSFDYDVIYKFNNLIFIHGKPVLSHIDARLKMNKIW